MGEKEFSFRDVAYDGPVLMRMRDVKLKPSSHKGVFVGTIIGAETGFNTLLTCLYLHHIPPGVNTASHRHDDTLVHVLTGRGHSVIDGVKYEWEPGDSIHIKPGAWHQHFNTSAEPANMLAAKVTPFLSYIRPYPMVERESNFVEIPKDFVPEHPFGLGKQEVEITENGIGSHFAWRRKYLQSLAERLKNAQTIRKGKDVRWEQSGGHEGELDASLIDPSVGFDTRIVFMDLQCLPPGGCNEMHQHGEAIVHILSGRGYVLVDGKRIDWERGDTIYVPPRSWHQHWNADKTGQVVQLRIVNGVFMNEHAPFPWIEDGEGSPASQIDPAYVPTPPW